MYILYCLKRIGAFFGTQRHTHAEKERPGSCFEICNEKRHKSKENIGHTPQMKFLDGRDRYIGSIAPTAALLSNILWLIVPTYVGGNKP